MFSAEDTSGMHQTFRFVPTHGSCGTSMPDLAPCISACVDLQGCTALHYAAHRGSNGTVGALLSAGADANIASFTVCCPARAYKISQKKLFLSVLCASGRMPLLALAGPQKQHPLALSILQIAWHRSFRFCHSQMHLTYAFGWHGCLCTQPLPSGMLLYIRRT